MKTCCRPSLALIIGCEFVQGHLKDWSLPKLNHGDGDSDRVVVGDGGGDVHVEGDCGADAGGADDNNDQENWSVEPLLSDCLGWFLPHMMLRSAESCCS